MPSELGGAWRYRRILSKLRRCEYLGPPWWRKELEAGTADLGMNLEAYTKNVELYIRALTADWGWTHRDISERYTTEFYTFYCQIKFRYCQALVREHIVRELNRLMSTLRISCSLRIEGIPTASDIQKTLEQLIAGEITMDEAYEQTSVV